MNNDFEKHNTFKSDVYSIKSYLPFLSKFQNTECKYVEY